MNRDSVIIIKYIIILNIYFTIDFLSDLNSLFHSSICALIALISDQSVNMHILSLFMGKYIVSFSNAFVVAWPCNQED